MEGQGQGKGGEQPHAPKAPDSSDEVNSLSSVEDTNMERALLWKMDLHILPFVVLLYLFSFLDRGAFDSARRPST